MVSGRGAAEGGADYRRGHDEGGRVEPVDGPINDRIDDATGRNTSDEPLNPANGGVKVVATPAVEPPPSRCRRQCLRSEQRERIAVPPLRQRLDRGLGLSAAGHASTFSRGRVTSRLASMVRPRSGMPIQAGRLPAS